MKAISVRQLVCLGLATVSALTPLLRAAEAKPGQPKTHVLYMGADLFVQQGKKFAQVEDVDGSEFVIRVNGENRFVRTRARTTNLKLNPGLKLSTATVQLDGLQGGPGYTPAADPRHKFNARSGAAAGAQAANELATYNINEINASLGSLRPDDPRVGQLTAELHKQEGYQATSDYQMNNANFGSIPGMANELALELDQANYDMVDISFKISSPVPLDDPYMVVLVEFHPREAKPGESSLMIHAKSLEPIDAKPKYIRIREGGMPVGFKFDRFEVHIYNRGKEVATNASAKRVELTEEEARQYMVIDYIGAHKGATVQASAVVGSLPQTRRQQLSVDQLNRTCYARVAKDGRLLGAYADEGCTLQISDDGTRAAFDDIFFNPSLHEGKPVEGVARFRLADL